MRLWSWWRFYLAPPRAAFRLLPLAADAAVTELRKRGLAAATKKASRHAAEGLVGLATREGAAAVVEVRVGAQPQLYCI
jgi:hypothetical protein